MSGDIQTCAPWLEKLRGKTPALKESDWELLLKVQSVAHKKFNPKKSQVITGRMSKELFSLVNCLKKLVEQQETYSESGRYFQQNYPKWRNVRDTNTKTLREMANAIQETKENCDGVRLAGSVASLLGGGASLAADDEDDDSFLANLGRGMSLLGSAFAAGSTLVEEFLLEVKLNEAKVIVEKDRYLFDYMWPSHIDSSKEVASSIDDIFEEIGMNRHQWRNIRCVIDNFLSQTSRKRSETEVEISIAKMLNCINLPSALRGEICDVVSAIMAILMVWKNNRPMLELVSAAYKIKSQFETLSGRLLSTFNVWSKYENCNSSSPKKSVVVIGMLMDVACVAKACSDISNKSQREESVLLRKIAKILEDEADKLGRMYYQFPAQNRFMYS